MALSKVQVYALTKKFLFKSLFKKFPGLHSIMLAESFCRYLREFRKNCGKKRTDTIKKLNMKKQYSQINVEKKEAFDQKKIEMKKAMKVQLPADKDTKEQDLSRPEDLAVYKKKLEILNEKSNDMFEHIK